MNNTIMSTEFISALEKEIERTANIIRNIKTVDRKNFELDDYKRYATTLTQLLDNYSITE